MTTQKTHTEKFFELLRTYNTNAKVFALKTEEYKERFEPLWDVNGYDRSVKIKGERKLAKEIEQASVVMGYAYGKLRAFYAKELEEYAIDFTCVV